MIKKLLVALFLLVNTTSYSQESETSQNGYNDPYLYIQKKYGNHPKIEMSKDKSSVTMQTERGKMQVTCGVENDDFISQCKERWKKSKKSTDSKKDSKDEDESHAPSVSMKFTWSTDD